MTRPGSTLAARVLPVTTNRSDGTYGPSVTTGRETTEERHRTVTRTRGKGVPSRSPVLNVQPRETPGTTK